MDNYRIEYVCIHGQKGSGKSTLARMIRDYLGHAEWTIEAFADPLKKLCSATYHFPLNYAYNQDGKNVRLQWGIVNARKDLIVPPLCRDNPLFVGVDLDKIVKIDALATKEYEFMFDMEIPITVGRTLQTIGELCRLVLGATFWANILVHSKRPEQLVGVIIEDLRHIEESEVMHHVNPLTFFVRIERDASYIKPDSRSTVHPSEMPIENCDIHWHTIINNGDRMDLAEKAMCLARKIATGNHD